MVRLLVVKKEDVFGKTVFLRADLDAPLSEVRSQKSRFARLDSARLAARRAEVRIGDEMRLVATLPTIEYLLKQNAKIIIAGHLGRPNGKIDKSLSLEPIAKWFDLRLEINDLISGKRGEFNGWEIGSKIFLLENLRFYEGEEGNDPKFAKKLASLADVYVNDAFAMTHRNHASIVGITKFLPHFAGFHLEKEISVLSKVLRNPRRPLVVLIGGKKIETKLPLVEKMHRIADYVLVGGKIAEESKVLVKVQHEKIKGRKGVLLIADSNLDKTDITEQDAENFLQIINLAKTIIWNGSMGVVGTKAQNLPSETGTRKIAKGIIESKAYSIVGGGDTVEFLNKLGILNKFSFASTGGGAMLSFLSGEKLPGLDALIR